MARDPGQQAPPLVLLTPTSADAGIEGDVLELFYVLYEPLRAHFAASAGALGLNPIQVKVLRSLTQPMAQRLLAEQLAVDASYITQLIDQLESSGLVARRAAPEDRRVKQVTLTAQGRRVRTAFENLLYQDVPGVAALTQAQATTLRATLRRMYDALAPEAASG